MTLVGEDDRCIRETPDCPCHEALLTSLLTFTPLKYIDPEGVTSRMGDYPLVKLYSFGLNINF